LARNLLPALVSIGVLGACHVVEIREPVANSAEMRVGVPARSWEIVDERGEAIGLLVRFDVSGSPEDSLYMVRNVWHQDLGLVDAHGRAFRYLPHHREPAWIGCGTVLEGVERILKREDCALAEMPFDEPVRPPAPGEIEPARNPFPEPPDGRALEPRGESAVDP
jgi:hypothetical protein